ncbi:Uncharacterized protein BP5553_02593 [Venustampulla echinocandica]|uniref:Aminoglycoside phosphotransferase domain-containing protein n=1 Tax=Venustampulla echinocandica TaxID=2656787 RepID=A0A370TRX9_9HELO|nr:Uncharacterized protein BP5553_02593 [Venustampulla echinocandica]RDL38253.1 Uncharacterized protein BP5553_02593 [Venustampulla echinocandica]
MSTNAELATTQLPDGSKADMVFLESSFFRTHGQKQLPTPQEVRAKSPAPIHHPQPPPVKFEELGLIVKYGPSVSVAEAQCLWVIKHLLSIKVPVPEVYAWRVDAGHGFIYMELIYGEPLRDRWDSLVTAERTAICIHLREIVNSLREVRQDPSEHFVGKPILNFRTRLAPINWPVGSINQGPLLDIIFEYQPPAGPFATIKHFNDWFSQLPQNRLLDTQKYECPYRPFLPDNGAITFTHGDLHRGNIMVSSTNPPQIVAIVDWGQAGWYPDYWEYCKALYTSHYAGTWRQQWIPMFLDCRTEEHEVFAEYFVSIGAI